MKAHISETLLAAFRRKEGLGFRSAATTTTVFSLKSRNVELAPATIVVHVTDLAEYRALCPAHVVDAKHGPRKARVAVGVASV